jgi:hypothetical protein
MSNPKDSHEKNIETLYTVSTKNNPRKKTLKSIHPHPHDIAIPSARLDPLQRRCRFRHQLVHAEVQPKSLGD